MALYYLVIVYNYLVATVATVGGTGACWAISSYYYCVLCVTVH
jgi:hypothetical protein